MGCIPGHSVCVSVCGLCEIRGGGYVRLGQMCVVGCACACLGGCVPLGVVVVVGLAAPRSGDCVARMSCIRVGVGRLPMWAGAPCNYAGFGEALMCVGL